MIGKEDVSGKPVSTSEALEILEERKKGGELGYEQQLAYDHAKKFATISVDKTKKMRDELSELEISDKTIMKIIDVMPVNEVQLKNTLLIEKRSIEEERVKKIFEVVNKYRK